MAHDLSLTTALKKTRILRCPNCNEIINNASEVCRFCSAPLDPKVAQAAADDLEKINKACSDASSVKIIAQAMLPMIGISFIPFIGLAGVAGCAFLVFAVPFMATRWWLRVRAIQRSSHNTADLSRAKRSVKIAVVIWALLMPIGLFRVLIGVLPLLGMA